MSEEIAAPVNGIIKAFHRGNERTQKICMAASRNATAAQVLDTVEPAQALQKSLAESEAQIGYAYSESIRILGRRYESAIHSDPVSSGTLKDITINLKEQLDMLSDYLEDPDTFDLGSFQMIQRESERCREQAIGILGSLHRHMLSMQQYQMPVQDDRSQLTSQRQTTGTGTRPESQVSPMNTIAPQSFAARISTEERRTTTRISSPSHYQVNIPTEPNIPTGTSYGSYRGEGHPSTHMPESSSRPDSAVHFIDRADIVRQVTSNEDFLEKRIRSRQSYRQDMEHLRQSSTSTTATTSPRPGLAQTSPNLAYSAECSESPSATSRPNSYHLMARTQSREGASTLSPMGPSPRYSDPLPDRQDSAVSDLLIFGPPESPSNSSRHSAAEGHGDLARTLRVPGYGEGVPDGIQVVGQLVSDPGLFLANEDDDQPIPAPLPRPRTGYPLRRNASFHEYGGFCPGAHLIRRGTKGAQEVRKKPGAHLDAHISVKCINCKYEISWKDYEKDNFLYKDGFYTLGDIRFRQRFLSKSHMQAAHTSDSAYACIFCVDEDKTVEDFDATIFFSLKQLFRHIERHARPLKAIEGIIVIYNEPDVVDFDIDFLTMEPKPSPHASVEGNFRNMPRARAITDHYERAKGYKKEDPEHRTTLQFAKGARIAGITYSLRTNAIWCFGYHDGNKGYFPATAVAFDLPSEDDVPISPASTLWATAKFDHKPKEPHGGWLVFKKGDKITNVDYTSQDAWCYSGYHKGKRGLFPACFIEGLKQDATLAQTSSNTGRHASGDVSPRGHTGLGSFMRRRTTATSTTSV